jgi:hypothetical protein
MTQMWKKHMTRYKLVFVGPSHLRELFLLVFTKNKFGMSIGFGFEYISSKF